MAAVNRIDNVKTAIIAGAGACGTIHPAYRAYARAVGFHVDACAPRAPQAKGKGEAKVKLSRQSVALLIADEVGFQPLSRLEAGLLFRLVSYRYQRGSMILTTNKSVKDWPKILAGDEVMTTALLDRRLRKSHVLNIRGRSYRLRELEKALK